MNKTEFIARVAEEAGLTKVDARKAVEAFAEVVAAELKKGEKIALLGFGTFSVADKPAREGINPATKHPHPCSQGCEVQGWCCPRSQCRCSQEGSRKEG